MIARKVTTRVVFNILLIKKYFSVRTSDGNVGIGVTKPTSKLEVIGSMTASSVNGEKTPWIFDVGTKEIPDKWQAVNQNIKEYCGDADGCTIKILFRVISTDEVKCITEQLYIEQPDKSNNNTPGLSGYSLQLGGAASSFILNTPAAYDLIPYPWNWMYIRNYGNANVPNLPQGVYTGYNVQFLVPPNVTATVIIYDR